MLIDMGIHDFDLARWFMGDVQTVSAIGATIAYPELATVGDIDNAIASLTFTSGKLGVVDLTRSGIYGYDISTEILGLEGTIRIGYLRETPIMVMTKANWRRRTTRCRISWSASATPTRTSCRTSRRTCCSERTPPITIDDGMEALRIGVAATRAQESGKSVIVADDRADGDLDQAAIDFTFDGRSSRLAGRTRASPDQCVFAIAQSLGELLNSVVIIVSRVINSTPCRREFESLHELDRLDLVRPQPQRDHTVLDRDRRLTLFQEIHRERLGDRRIHPHRRARLVVVRD